MVRPKAHFRPRPDSKVVFHSTRCCTVLAGGSPENFPGTPQFNRCVWWPPFTRTQDRGRAIKPGQRERWGGVWGRHLVVTHIRDSLPGPWWLGFCWQTHHGNTNTNRQFHNYPFSLVVEGIPHQDGEAGSSSPSTALLLRGLLMHLKQSDLTQRCW